MINRITNVDAGTTAQTDANTVLPAVASTELDTKDKKIEKTFARREKDIKHCLACGKEIKTRNKTYCQNHQREIRLYGKILTKDEKHNIRVSAGNKACDKVGRERSAKWLNTEKSINKRKVTLRNNEEFHKILSPISQGRKSRTNKSSQYVGVSYSAAQWNSKKWNARIYKDSVLHRLGYFETEIEAAIAYDKKALELFGENAKLNFMKL